MFSCSKIFSELFLCIFQFTFWERIMAPWCLNWWNQQQLQYVIYWQPAFKKPSFSSCSFLNPKQYQAVSLILLYDCIRLSFSNLSRGAKLTISFHSKKRNKISIDDFHMGSYVSCVYKKEWHGINEVSNGENVVPVKFLHPINLSVDLHWPAIEVKCHLPVNHILQLLSIPFVNFSGCPYTFLKS